MLLAAPQLAFLCHGSAHLPHLPHYCAPVVTRRLSAGYKKKRISLLLFCSSMFSQFSSEQFFSASLAGGAAGKALEELMQALVHGGLDYFAHRESSHGSNSNRDAKLVIKVCGPLAGGWRLAGLWSDRCGSSVGLLSALGGRVGGRVDGGSFRSPLRAAGPAAAAGAREPAPCRPAGLHRSVGHGCRCGRACPGCSATRRRRATAFSSTRSGWSRSPTPPRRWTTCSRRPARSPDSLCTTT